MSPVTNFRITRDTCLPRCVAAPAKKTIIIGIDESETKRLCLCKIDRQKRNVFDIIFW